VQRLPEAERTVADGELGGDGETVLTAKTQEHLAPTLGAFAVAVLDRQQLLAAVDVSPDEDEDALAVVVEVFSDNHRDRCRQPLWPVAAGVGRA
jgi:hypothetical protein